MNLIDIGANLTHENFQDKIGSVIAEARQVGVEHIVVTGTDGAANARARELSIEWKPLSFTAGIHPHCAVSADHPDLNALVDFWSHPNCVAVGECGLDYHRMYRSAEKQKECLIAILRLSRLGDLPLFLHLRDADRDLIEIINTYALGRKMVVHCFTGGRDTLKRLLDAGALIGLTGWLCDERRNRELVESLPYLPIDRVMIETDSPWLTPRTQPRFRKIRHNRPCYLPAIVESLAAYRRMDAEELARQIRRTTIDFFDLNLD